VIEALGAAHGDALVELRIAGVIEDRSYWSRCQQLTAEATVRRRGLTISYLGHLDYDATDVLCHPPVRHRHRAVAMARTARRRRARSDVRRRRRHRLERRRLNDTLVHDHNGLHAIPGDIDSWASALTALLEHPGSARRLGHQAHHDFAGIAIDDHLDDLVSTQRRPQS
jgi:hypothetical protein